MKEKINIQSQLEQYLHFMKMSGIDYLPVKRRANASTVPKEAINEEPPSSVPQSITSDLEKIRTELADCSRCRLGKTRTNLVFGTGDRNADLVFVGEAPGRDEDLQGEPFVGKAGQLLTKIIEAISLKRENVYICNVLKCRPPQNRNPLPEEIECCEPFLIKQIRAIKPKVICALGKFAAQTLLKSEAPISTLRGKFHNYHGVPLMPTYHPAFLLRNPKMKKEVWQDVQLIQKVLKGKIDPSLL
ncbi:MAG: uracil-DNA glycosylase [Deltaproteobacteria bacterium]|nr:uracil-DNA glycosylase [Deltaproteobacteria bacterium]